MSTVSMRTQSPSGSWRSAQSAPAAPVVAAAAPAEVPQSNEAAYGADGYYGADAFDSTCSDGGFSSEARAIGQTSDSSCGLAALASVNSASASCLSDEQLLDLVQENANAINGQQTDAFSNLVDLSNGTTPQEMSMLLGQQGQQVMRGFGNFDADSLKWGARYGEFGMMLVDANALHNTTDGKKDGVELPEGQGDLHWITVDAIKERGENGETLYRVKDPGASQRTYTLTGAELENMVNQARNGVHQTGGGLIVKNRPDVTEKQDRHILAQENLKQAMAETLGDNDGVGRNQRLGAVSS